MRDDNEIYLIIEGIIFYSVLVMASIYGYFKFHLSLIIVSILVLIYIFTAVAFFLRTFFLILITRTAKRLRFRIITGYFEQPKMMGHYKHHLWQLHYREKESGHFPGVLRTYVKLIFNENKKFDTKKLEKLVEEIQGVKIFKVKHIVKENKNYLLMKAYGFIFSKDIIHSLMDELLLICEKTEIKNG